MQEPSMPRSPGSGPYAYVLPRGHRLGPVLAAAADDPSDTLDSALGFLLAGARTADVDFGRAAHESSTIGGFGPRSEGHRWLHASGQLLLGVPAGADHLLVEGFAPSALLETGPLALEVRCGTQEVGRIAIEADGPFQSCFRIEPAAWPRPFERAAVLEFAPSRTFVPAEAAPGSSPYSVALARVALGTLEGSGLHVPAPFDAALGLRGSSEPPPEAPHLRGVCLVCASPAWFALEAPEYPRDALFCPACGAGNRLRHLVRGLLLYLRSRGFAVNTLPGLREGVRDPRFAIYDTHGDGVIARALAGGGFTLATSEYHPERPLGTELRPGHFNQDLSALTFEDGAFDVVLTSDVFEHVRLDRDAFRQLRRVLKPGGALVFTVPHVLENERDEILVEVVDRTRPASDRPLAAPVHHLDPLRAGGSLVYRFYGRELFETLSACGFDVTYERTSIPALGIWRSEVFVALAR